MGHNNRGQHGFPSRYAQARVSISIQRAGGAIAFLFKRGDLFTELADSNRNDLQRMQHHFIPNDRESRVQR